MSNKQVSKPTDTTRQHVLAASGNICAFPTCNELIFDLEHRVLVGKIAHIKGAMPGTAKKRGSARYDPEQDPEERHSFANLIALCGTHHDIIDGREDIYTVPRLFEMKTDHESKVANSIDREWIVPPNSSHFLDEDGSQVSVYYWIDRTGRPRIYSAEQLAKLETLKQIYLDLCTLTTVMDTLPSLNEPNVQSLLQQSWAKITTEEGQTPLVKLLLYMARIPEITFGEFTKYLVEGNDPTNVLVKAADELKTASKSKAGVSIRKVNDA